MIVESNPDVTEIGFRELRLESDAIVEGVKSGRSYIVSRKSSPVFKIVPLDEEVWETIIDFRQIDPSGVDIADVLTSMDKLNTKRASKHGRSNPKVSR